MTTFLLLALVFLVGLRILAGTSAPKDDTVVAVKQCPPHKWSYKEVKDTEGNVVSHKLECAICGPYKGFSTGNGDYS